MKSLFSLFSNTPPFNHLMNMKKKDYPIVSFTSSSLRCAQKYSTNIYLWKMPPSPTNHGTFIWTNWHICHSHFSMWKILVRKYNTHCILRKVLGQKIIHHEICTEALFIATLWEERSIAQPFQKSQRTSVPYLLPSILQYVC